MNFVITIAKELTRPLPRNSEKWEGGIPKVFGKRASVGNEGGSQPKADQPLAEN
ncbi:hypothetical protein [Marivirga sp.]|uniref:hypothetical protein n=1 Tax=Marivirga sp. TaxID=2018662 RepID=UPI0025DE762C|nr:hypothetical protein [Marivirga sp.]